MISTVQSQCRLMNRKCERRGSSLVRSTTRCGQFSIPLDVTSDCQPTCIHHTPGPVGGVADNG